MNTLLISLIFGSLGMGYFIYGKNTGNFVPLGAGVALMVIPYFISNITALLIVCLLLSAAPFFVRES